MPASMMKENILFLRNRPRYFNLGDFLCTPMHYFDFSCNAYESAFFLKNKPHKVILGGGAFNDLGLGQNVDHKKTVLWGVGSSVHGRDSKPTQGDDLPYALYGLRDPDAVSDPAKLLPCVTCLHPLVQLPAGKDTGVFLNFDQGVTDLHTLRNDPFFRDNDLQIFTNFMNELRFMKAFSGCRRIITNSYHVSYWSLLSGREVAIVGYSSKFRSLMKLVGLNPDSLNYYDTSNQAALKQGIRETLGNQLFHQVPRFAEIRNSFVEKNIRFAEQCKAIGFVADAKLRAHSPLTMMGRNLKYAAFQGMANLRKPA
jgi:hypothetical protein